MVDPASLDFKKGNGLVTVVTQDARTAEVLMVAHADRKAVEKTIESGEMHYHSRSRGLWRKGATSGNTQKVVALAPDCDGDALLARVIPAGPACHEGKRSCFGSAFEPDALTALDQVIAERADSLRAAVPSDLKSDDVSSASAEPARRKSYTRQLLLDRNLRLKKLGEELAELLVACADEDRMRATEEAADVLYHLLVALRGLGVGLDDLRAVLAKRAKGARP
jgi:phosphoribosyl-ATP pyrophosphohydrolase/phosphoribosyl-AMP cyclohydrolase